MSDVGSCRSCGQRVDWRRSFASGKAMPLEVDDVRGNVITDMTGRAHAFRDHAAAVAAAEDTDTFGMVGTYFLSHHATCPAGEQWRGRRREDVAAPESLF